MSTRELVIEKAIELFNRDRSTNVSTNMIAAEAGISPGNLYYHFKNKEEIIRIIYDKLVESMDPIFYDPEFALSETGIVNFFQRLNIRLYEFRFFYLEISVLLRNDPQLKVYYVERAMRLMERLEEVFVSWVKLGIMKPIPTERERRILARNVWTLGQLWITYTDILADQISLEQVYEGIWHFHSIIRPYFTAKSNRKIEKLLSQLPEEPLI